MYVYLTMRIYPEDSISRFEFDRIRESVQQHCRCAIAKEKAAQLLPFSQLEPILIQLNRTKELLHILQSGSYFPITSFPDISKEITLLSVANSILQEKQLINLRDVSDTVNTLVKYLSDKKTVLPYVNGIFESVYFTPDIINAIDAVLDTAGIVKSSASKDLADIRKNLAHVRRELDRVFRSQLAKLKKLGWLAETEETVYNGRRVLSVLAEQKRSVKGLIQGNSDTGKTSFIEPIETVELNNDVFELVAQERREIMRILKQLTSQIRQHKTLINNYQLSLIDFDFVRAKALFAMDIGATMPAVSKYPQVDLINARHPILVLQNKSSKKDVVPMSCSLNHKLRLLVISGPNAGGKSITLKTIGLLQMMLQSGLLVPVDEKSEMGIFHRLFADIGDSQSIEFELSTYSSRLAKMKYFLDFADNRTLILIDEFGTGTDPELGGAIAEAMLEQLAKNRTLGVITTHYMNIKLAADRLEGTKNASMLFDDTTLKPLYRLQIGQPGSSYTYIIAEKAGLPKALIDVARSKTAKDKVTLDRMLQQLHQQQQEVKKLISQLEEKEKQSDASKKKYDELFEKLKEKTERKKTTQEEVDKLTELGRKFKNISKEWESAKDKKPILQKITKTLSAERLKKLEKKQLEKKEKLKKEILEKKKIEIKIGTRVKLLNGKQIGIVEDIQNNKAKVTFGNLKTIASLETLEAIDY